MIIKTRRFSKKKKKYVKFVVKGPVIDIFGYGLTLINLPDVSFKNSFDIIFEGEDEFYEFCERFEKFKKRYETLKSINKEEK